MTLRNVYLRNVMTMNNYEELIRVLEKSYESINGDSPVEENPKKDEQKITDEEWEQFCKEEGLVDG